MIRWTNILHIYGREIRDQWRDRRTLLTVVFLPLLLYPMLGMAMMQVTQFMREKPTTVLVVGQQYLEEHRPLFQDELFDAEYAELKEARLTRLQFHRFSDDRVSVAAEQLCLASTEETEETRRWQELVQNEMRAADADALLFVASPEVLQRLERWNADAKGQAQGAGPHGTDGMDLDTDHSDSQAQSETATVVESGSKIDVGVPQIRLFQSSSSDQSRVAGSRIGVVLKTWYQDILRERLKQENVDESILQPFHYESRDLARTEVVNAHIWSKILPFILFLWMLTGSFYCAVDLCAGEKERGTLETLLCSPASRREIVIGKLLTTMSFSSLSGALNVTCTVVTGVLLARQFATQGDQGDLLASIGTPPMAGLFWLFLAMLPISALFGALSIAIAAFARSSKEGQHYLMPFLMVCLPLIIIPVVQGIEFDLGLSLIPITGMMFLLRLLVEGQYQTAFRFLIPVLLVNGWCVHLAIGWAVSQFNQESVLFRPSDRFSLWKWITSRLRKREDLPTLGQVILCTAVILSMRFFLQIAAVAPGNWNQFAGQSTLMLLLAVALPAVLFALMFTRSAVRTLRLRVHTISSIGGAFLLAILFHPLIMAFQNLVVAVYPVSSELGGVQQVMMSLFADAPSMWSIILVLAILPAICEELAFRGFILSGLQRLERPGNTLLISALLFGITHGFLQQSIVASFTGVILGLLALKTGSLIPCIVYHATHNAITLQLPLMQPETIEQSRLLQFVFAFQLDEQGSLIDIHYHALPSLIMIVFGLWLLLGMENWEEDDQPSPLSTRRTSLRPGLSEV